MRLNKQQLEVVKNIQSSLYNDLLNLQSKIEFENFFYGIFIVFLTQAPDFQLDWKLMNSFDFGKCSLYEKRNEPDCIEQIIENKNIVKFKSNRNRLFIIKQIEETVRASNNFPKKCDNDEQITFAQFFKEKYGLETTEISQPLVELTQVEISLNFLLKPIVFKKEKPEKIRKFKELFLLEHVIILPFTKSQTNTLTLCPAVIHRLDCLFRALKLKNLIEIQITKDLNITNVSGDFIVNILALNSHKNLF